MVNSRTLGIVVSGLLLSLCFACASHKAAAHKQDLPLETVRAHAKAAEQEMRSTKNTTTQTGVPATATAIVHKQPDGKVTVEIDTLRVFNDAVTPKDARAQTLQFVRQLALEKALPVDVMLTSLFTDMYVERNFQFDESTAQSVYIISSSAGRFISEDILQAEYNYRDYSYRMKYRATILPLSQTYNSAMELKAKLSNTLLRDGDKFDLEISANTDGYLYIFDFMADNSVALVFPTLNYPSNKLSKDESWKQSLTAVNTPGKDFSIETLYFVFCKEPISGWEEFRSNRNADELVFSAGEESFILFQKWLGKSDPAMRMEKMAQIHIVK